MASVEHNVRRIGTASRAAVGSARKGERRYCRGWRARPVPARRGPRPPRRTTTPREAVRQWAGVCGARAPRGGAQSRRQGRSGRGRSVSCGLRVGRRWPSTRDPETTVRRGGAGAPGVGRITCGFLVEHDTSWRRRRGATTAASGTGPGLLSNSLPPIGSSGAASCTCGPSGARRGAAIGWRMCRDRCLAGRRDPLAPGVRATCGAVRGPSSGSDDNFSWALLRHCGRQLPRGGARRDRPRRDGRQRGCGRGPRGDAGAPRTGGHRVAASGASCCRWCSIPAAAWAAIASARRSLRGVNTPGSPWPSSSAPSKRPSRVATGTAR